MIGRQGVVLDVPRELICLDPWTRERVERVLDEAVKHKKPSAIKFLDAWFDMANRERIFYRIQAFLGHEQNTYSLSTRAEDSPPVCGHDPVGTISCFPARCAGAFARGCRAAQQ